MDERSRAPLKGALSRDQGSFVLSILLWRGRKRQGRQLQPRLRLVEPHGKDRQS